MKIISPSDMDQVTGTCCRQSPLRGLVGSLIVCAFLIGFVFLLWNRGIRWFVWGGCAVLAAFLVPVFLRDALSKFRSTNWLLRIGPDGLWINLRNHQNHLLPEAATVVHLPYDEIASGRRHIDTWTTPAEPARSHGNLLETGVTRTVTGVRGNPGDRTGPDCRARASRHD